MIPDFFECTGDPLPAMADQQVPSGQLFHQLHLMRAQQMAI